MGLMYFPAAHLLQCQSSLCFHPVIKLLLLYFYIASLWLRRFLWDDRRPEVFAPSFLCVWSQTPWRSLQITVSPQGFFTRTPKILGIIKICDIVKSVRCSPFLFDELCKLNLLFTFFTYLGIYVSTDD